MFERPLQRGSKQPIIKGRIELSNSLEKTQALTLFQQARVMPCPFDPGALDPDHGVATCVLNPTIDESTDNNTQ